MSFSERARSALNQKCTFCEKGLHDRCLRRKSDSCCCGVEPGRQVTPSSSVEHPENEKEEEAQTKQEEEKTKQEEAKTKQVVEEGKMTVPVQLSESDSEEIRRMAGISVSKKTSGPKRKRERAS